MTGLILETSTLEAILALNEHGTLETIRKLPAGDGLSKNFLPSVQELINDKKLDYVAVGIGPGSYTGTRVGATVAKTLSFALNIPLISFSSSLALELPELAHLLHEKWQNREFSKELEVIYLNQL